MNYKNSLLVLGSVLFCTLLIMSCSLSKSKLIKSSQVQFLQSAFNSGIDTLTLEKDGLYVITKELRVENYNNLVIEGNGATIMFPNNKPLSNEGLIKFQYSQNIKIENLTLDGNKFNRRGKHLNSHNIKIYNCKDVILENVNSINSGSDGFIVSPTSPKNRIENFCHNIYMYNCHADHASRNGLSIVGAFNMEVIGGSFNNTKGVRPGYGIDIEADDPNFRPGNKDILLSGVEMKDNHGGGLAVISIGFPENVTIHDCDISNSPFGLKLAGTNIKVDSTRITDCDLGIKSLYYEHLGQPADNNIITNNIVSYCDTGIEYSGFGGRIINNQVNHIKDNGIWLRGNLKSKFKAIVAENVIENIGGTGIYSLNFENTTISHNKIVATGEYGVLLGDGTYLASNNLIDSTQKVGIEISGSEADLVENIIKNTVEHAIEFNRGGKTPARGKIIRNKISNTKGVKRSVIIDHNGLITECVDNEITTLGNEVEISLQNEPAKFKHGNKDKTKVIK